MKKITFILTSMLFLLVGGVFSQTQLELTGGTNRDVPSGDHPMSGIIQFKDKGIRSCLGGSAWAASYNPGETHTFTVTLEDSGNDDCTLYLGAYSQDISQNWYGSYTPIAEQSISVSATKTLTLTVSESYHGVYLYATYASGVKNVNIRSITRTITTASSVGKPTITAPATYDGESTAVTITPGANNHHVKYSVSGSSSDVSNVQITSETTIYITGSNDVTITAVGYNEDESDSNTDTKTITYSIPSGIVTAWSSDPQQFSSWDDKAYLNHENFSSLEIGDYIYLNCSSVDGDNRIGFRTSSFGNSPFDSYDALYMPITDGISKLKITDATIRDAFKNDNPVIQGYTFTLDNVQIHKHVDINEGANTISKSTDMIVNLGRSFTANTWNTVCLPFVPTSAQADELFGSGYQLAAFTGVSGTTMRFTTIDIAAFEAGKPYLVMPKTGCASGTTVLFDVNITAKNPTPVTFGNYTFTGTFTTKTFTSADNTTSRFVATGNKLVTPNENSTLKSLRCYFTVPVAAARSLSFDVDEEGNTTGVADINRETITNNGDFFNLAGQRVAQPTKGLYIVNGKKVVIK